MNIKNDFMDDSMSYSRIPKRKISFLGTGEKYERTVNGQKVTSYRPFKTYSIDPLFFVNPELKYKLSMKRGIDLRSNEEAIEFLRTKGGMFSISLPQRAVVRRFNRGERGWNVENRTMRIYVTLYVIYKVAFEDYLMDITPFPIVQEFHHTFGFRTSLRRIKSEKAMLYFYLIMERYSEMVLPDRIPVGLSIGLIDVGWRSPYEAFPNRELRRLRKLGFFDHSYKRALSKVRAIVDRMM